MYNGIGILTTRGTGTSGYVQSNRFNLRNPPPQRTDAPGEGQGPTHRRPNKDILEHNKKREIELQVEAMRAQLEDDGLPDDEIEEKLAVYRADLLAKLAAQSEQELLQAAARENRGGGAQETHQIAQRKEEQMDRLANAFGISRDNKEGEAFDKEIQEQKRLQRIAEREAKIAEKEEREIKRKKDIEKLKKRGKKEEKKRKRDEEKAAKRSEKERKREEKRWKSDGYYTKDADAVPDRYDPSITAAGAGAADDIEDKDVPEAVATVVDARVVEEQPPAEPELVNDKGRDGTAPPSDVHAQTNREEQDKQQPDAVEKQPTTQRARGRTASLSPSPPRATRKRRSPSPDPQRARRDGTTTTTRDMRGPRRSSPPPPSRRRQSSPPRPGSRKRSRSRSLTPPRRQYQERRGNNNNNRRNSRSRSRSPARNYRRQSPSPRRNRTRTSRSPPRTTRRYSDKDNDKIPVRRRGASPPSPAVGRRKGGRRNDSPSRSPPRGRASTRGNTKKDSSRSRSRSSTSRSSGSTSSSSGGSSSSSSGTSSSSDSE